MKTPLSPFLIVFLAACSAAPKSAHLLDAAGKGESGVEIKYSLALTLYRLEVTTKGNEAIALSGVNDQPIERKKINSDQFSTFLERASLIAQEISRTESANDLKDCKTPYTLTLKKEGTITRKVSGCRSDDPEGRIGRLIQEGEFLFYSPRSAADSRDPAINQ